MDRITVKPDEYFCPPPSDSTIDITTRPASSGAVSLGGGHKHCWFRLTP